MGFRFLDQYSLLHFAVGVIAYFWSVPFWIAFGAHFTFEVLENIPIGISVINTYFSRKGMFRWPGDKIHPDSLLNFAGDNIVFAVGFLLAQWLNEKGKREGWYYKQ